MSPQSKRVAFGIALLAYVPVIAVAPVGLSVLALGVPRAPYWLAALFPLCAAGAYLWRSR